MTGEASSSTTGHRFSLTPREPFHLGHTVWALRRRPHNSVDRWDGETYRRLLVVQGVPTQLSVRSLEGGVGGPLSVHVSGKPLTRIARREVSSALNRLLGIQVDLNPFYRLARKDPRLHALVLRFKGVKPPRFTSTFESLVNGIACQQLSLTMGIELLNRLSRACGPTLGGEPNSGHAFPRPADILTLDVRSLRAMGFSQHKATALLGLARRVDQGLLRLDILEHMDNSSAVELLDAIPGIGRWTAEYALLRGLGRLDMYPGDDVGARNRLARWLHRREPLDYEGVADVTRQWQPYAGVVYFHMLLAGLEESGLLA